MAFLAPIMAVPALGAAVSSASAYTTAIAGAVGGAAVTAAPVIFRGLERYVLGPLANGAGFYLGYKGADSATKYVNEAINKKHGDEKNTIHRKPPVFINQ